MIVSFRKNITSVKKLSFNNVEQQFACRANN